MTEFTLDGIVAKAKLKPGTYRLFTDKNADMPWGGIIDDLVFTVPEAGVVTGGTPGLSAYDVWIAAGNTGTQADFLMSLKGKPGDPGTGAGLPGKSAYDLAVDAGFVGTVSQWLASLKGEPGTGAVGGNVYNMTIVGGTLPKPTTTAQLQALWDDAAANKYVVRLAPGTKINLDQTIVIKQTGHDGSVWGVDGGFAQIDWVGAAGQDMFRVEGINGEPNRGFVCVNFQFYGGGYDRAPAGACLRIYCPGGDNMAYYKPTLQNLYTSYATNGFVFEGAVFEFSNINLHAENHRGDGMVAISVGGAIMSNVFTIAPNMSRNGGYGINTGWSHNVIMGSFIQNSKGGIFGPEGLRVGAFNNGENTGEALFFLPGNAYGTVLYGNEASTGWMAPNNFGLPSTEMKYLLNGVASTLEHDGHIAGYNAADAHAAEIRVRK